MITNNGKMSVAHVVNTLGGAEANVKPALEVKLRAPLQQEATMPPYINGATTRMNLRTGVVST